MASRSETGGQRRYPKRGRPPDRAPRLKAARAAKSAIFEVILSTTGVNARTPDLRAPVCRDVTAALLLERGHSQSVIAEALGFETYSAVRSAARRVESTPQLQTLSAIIRAAMDSEVTRQPLEAELHELLAWMASAATPSLRRKTIVERALRGERLSSIAEDLGLSYERTRKLAREVLPGFGYERANRHREIVRRSIAGEMPADIAVALGVAERQVRRLSKPFNAIRRRAEVEGRRNEIIARAKAGMSYVEIAREMGLSKVHVRLVCRPVLGRRQAPPFDRQRARELYDRGLPDTGISRELKYSLEAVRLWRVKQGLPPHGKRPPPRDERHAEAVRLVELGATRADAAQAVGLSVAQVAGALKLHRDRTHKLRPKS